MDRDEGLAKLPPAMILLGDLHTVWNESEPFMSSNDLIERLVQQNPDYWGESSAYGKRLTQQRVGRLLAQGAKIHSSKNGRGERGYSREAFRKAWRQLGMDPTKGPSETVQTAKPSNVLGSVDPGYCPKCGRTFLPDLSCPKGCEVAA